MRRSGNYVRNVAEMNKIVEGKRNRGSTKTKWRNCCKSRKGMYETEISKQHPKEHFSYISYGTKTWFLLESDRFV